ncbi:hypothetical protein C7459_106254 [Tumebacillus permanentifrigoris]|uniref:Uncharacterized protein n=1 Tax=Tumebacillus permanentifrigoris TaxID=378543 RepID=A0A316DBF3_9BACL|nr:hypothetical protein C7459_106254 [Tumebacillus permanentifrigoris]
MNKRKTTLLAITCTLASTIMSTALDASPARALGISPQGACIAEWVYQNPSQISSMQFYKMSEGTHYINKTGRDVTFTSTISNTSTIGGSVNGSIGGGWGPINYSLGFQANASYAWSTSESYAMTVSNNYEGWNEYGVNRDQYTGYYVYVNQFCNESNGSYITVTAPRTKTVVGRTRFVM